MQYIAAKKIERAKQMLLTSDRTVAEIAHSLGYEDPFHFSKLFKKVTGIAPSDYRSAFETGS